MLRLDFPVTIETIQFVCFYAPSLKGPPGASSNWVVRLSDSVPLTKWNIKSLDDDTVTKLGLLVHLLVPQTTLTSNALGWGEVKMQDLDIFAII